MPLYREFSVNDWPLPAGNNANTCSTHAALAVGMTEKYNPVSSGSMPCALWNHTLYAVDKNDPNRLYAVDITTNTLKWRFTMDSRSSVILSLLSLEGYVYVRTDSRMYAIEDTGYTYTIKWAQEGVIGLNYSGDSLFYTTKEQAASPMVVSIDAKTGRQKFRVPVGLQSDEIGNLTVGGQCIYFILRNQKTDLYSKLYCMSAGTGRILWIRHLGVYGVISPYTPAYSGEKLYLDFEPGYQEKPLCLILAYDAVTGSSLWKYNLQKRFAKSSSSNRIAVTQDSVITLRSDGFLIAIHKDTGIERWKVKYAEEPPHFRANTDSRVNGITIAAQEMILLDNHGKIKMFDAATGALVKELIPKDDGCRPVAVLQDALLLTDLEKLVLYTAPSPADTVKPSAVLDFFNLPRFSPAEEGFNVTGASVRLSKTAYTEAEIRSENGKVIKHMDYGLLKQGGSYLLWNGTDDRNKPVPYGKYHFVLKLRDLQDNDQQCEFSDTTVTVGDIAGRVLKNVELRIKPGTQYSVIGFVPAGSLLMITDETDAWFKVSYQNTLTGYVDKTLVETCSVRE